MEHTVPANVIAIEEGLDTRGPRFDVYLARTLILRRYTTQYTTGVLDELAYLMRVGYHTDSIVRVVLGEVIEEDEDDAEVGSCHVQSTFVILLREGP